ncbi:hypothetical protein F2P79_006445 [Pimephales promelas]|nr:hypothetical protein F2P79_006445 [Pimephales promelas]
MGAVIVILCQIKRQACRPCVAFSTERGSQTTEADCTTPSGRGQPLPREEERSVGKRSCRGTSL